MKRIDNKSGFTLIEIIVVLIIVGVLAAIALPNLFSNVQKSGGGEAIAALGSDKSLSEGCVMGHPGSEAGACAGLSPFTATSHFTYAWGTAPTNGSSGGPYTIVATSTAAGLGTVILTKTTVTNSLSCSGTGAFVGIC